VVGDGSGLPSHVEDVVREWYCGFRRAVKQVVKRGVVRPINLPRGYWRPCSDDQGFEMTERGG
jgi:hypothetical protein